MNEAIKKLCQSGVFEPFLQIMKDIQVHEIKKSDNPYDIFYQLGKRDGQKEYWNDLNQKINDICHE